MEADQFEPGDFRSTDIHAVAAEAFATLGTGRQVPTFSARHPGFGLADAYQAAAALHRERERRGERPLGRKIGFTNRTIWPEYNVHAPVWGYVYDRTVFEMAASGMDFPLAGLAEPRIEPEIVFGLAAAPTPGMDEQSLLNCIEWVAHGIEVVQSMFPKWTFVAADTVAANGLHGALLIGPRHPVKRNAADWQRLLPGFSIDLHRDGELMDRGRAANVLDGPILALQHLVELLASDLAGPPLAAGEIVTTGTLTRALPVAPGEVWTTKLAGIPLEGARVRFT